MGSLTQVEALFTAEVIHAAEIKGRSAPVAALGDACRSDFRPSSRAGQIVGVSALPWAERRQGCGKAGSRVKGEMGAGEVVEDVKVVVRLLARIVILNKSS